MRPLEERFWQKVDVRGPAVCWHWTGAKNVDGYGILSVGRRGEGFVVASRASWNLHFGEIAPGDHVLHRCDNPSCVNPQHLFVGSNSENILDAMVKGRLPRGSKKTTSKLSESQVIEIRAAAGTQREIASQFRVSQSLVSRIRTGKAWVHLQL